LVVAGVGASCLGDEAVAPALLRPILRVWLQDGSLCRCAGSVWP